MSYRSGKELYRGLATREARKAEAPFLETLSRDSQNSVTPQKSPRRRGHLCAGAKALRSGTRDIQLRSCSPATFPHDFRVWVTAQYLALAITRVDSLNSVSDSAEQQAV